MHNITKKLKVAVLFGGRSGEHEVSLVSGTSVIDNLDKNKYEVIPIGITKQGKWISGDKSIELLKSGKAPDTSNALLAPEPNHISSQSDITTNSLGNVDVVIPVLHGPYGEDGTVQGLLELTGIPYVGCGVLASSLCMDKVMQKKVLDSENLKQTPYIWFWSKKWKSIKDKLIQNLGLEYPVFVKPANMGSSVGVFKVEDNSMLDKAVIDAMQYDRKIIIEQGVKNAREIEIAVIGNQNPKVSVPGEIIPSNDFYDYDAKYVDGKTKEKIPADITSKQKKEVQSSAIQAYIALDCEGMARVDFLLSDKGEIYINEINTIPGFTSISMYPKLWQKSGVPYSELLDELISNAQERKQEKSKLKSSYQPKQAWHIN